MEDTKCSVLRVEFHERIVMMYYLGTYPVYPVVYPGVYEDTA